MANFVGTGRCGVIGVGLLGVLGCGQAGGPASERAGAQTQALVGDAAGTSNGAKSVVTFSNGSALQCVGTVIGSNLVATTSACAGKLTSSTTVRIPDGATQDQFKVSTATGANAALAGFSGTGIAVLHFTASLGTSADITPALIPGGGLGASPLPGSLVGVDANSGLRTRFNATFNPVDTDFCFQSATNIQQPTDDGTPFFAPSSNTLLGIVDQSGGTSGNCFGTGAVALLGLDSLPRIRVDNFNGNDENRFTALLAPNGPIYGVQLFFDNRPNDTFQASTSIPVGFQNMFGANTRPTITVISNPLGGTLRTIRVVTGAEPPTTETPVDCTANSGAACEADGVTPVLPTDLGMSYLLQGDDVVTLSGNTITTVKPSWKGFPSADGTDGRFLSIKGNGFSAPQVPTFRAFISCASTDVDQVQIFDGDSGGALDLLPSSNAPHACARLTVDPSKTPSTADDVTDAGCVSNTPDDESVFADADWSGLVVPTACATSHPGANATRNYRLEVFLTTGACNGTIPVPSTDPGAAIDLFKIRSTCNIEVTQSTFNFVGMDDQTSGDKGGLFHTLVDTSTGNLTGTLTPATTTWYERTGNFSFLVDKSQTASGSGSTHVTLSNLDADDCDVSGCNANGSSKSIHFLAFNADSVLPMTRVLPSTGWSGTPLLLGGPAVLRDQNPSGSVTGVASTSAPGVGEFDVQPSANDQLLAVMWRDVRVENTITQLDPSGSPVVFPMLSDTSRWQPVVSALTPAAWSTSPTALQQVLPVEIGDPGGRQNATTVAAAQQLLAGTTLASRVTAATLNIKRAHLENIDLENAVVRGTTAIVSDVLRAANRALVPNQPSPSTTLLDELDSINKALVFFDYSADPVLDPELDTDTDGIINSLDNCPIVSNPQQTDTHIFDDLGDACDPVPVVECVVNRGSGNFTGFFGYNNIYRTARLKNALNQFSPGAGNRNQPVLIRAGRHLDVVSSDFTNTLSWALAGTTVTASATSTACTGAEVMLSRVAPNVALLATDRMELGDRFQVTNLAAIAAGSSGVRLGHQSVVGDVFTSTNLQMFDNVQVKGSVRANSITPGHNDVIAGLQTVPGGVVLDSLGLSFPTFPAGTLQNVTVLSGTTALNPGNYGTVVVSNGATLALRTGNYTFRELTLNNDTHWTLNDASGRINIAVRDQFGFFERITTTASSGANPNLLLKFLGASATPVVTFFSSFTGSIYAPKAELNFQRGNLQGNTQKPFAGVFFGRRIIASNDTRFTYVPLLTFDAG